MKTVLQPYSKEGSRYTNRLLDVRRVMFERGKHRQLPGQGMGGVLPGTQGPCNSFWVTLENIIKKKSPLLRFSALFVFPFNAEVFLLF
jgi:hypothetical protein